MRKMKRAAVASLQSFVMKIRANPCLREEGRKKDKFALKWVR